MNSERLEINQYEAGIEVIVPAKKSGFISGFLVLWMLAWSYGELSIIGRLIHGNDQFADAFMMIWSCAWSLGGFVAVLLWLWNLKGREIILISNTEIRRYREFVLFSRSELYECRHVNNLRVNEIDLSSPDMVRGPEFWGLSGGMISFDYGEGTGKFGLGIGDEEANRIVEVVKSRYQSL